METKGEAPAAKRRKCVSSDALTRQVHAIAQRVKSLRDRGVDAHNTVGRGRLPAVLMGVLWSFLGPRGIARTARTSAAVYNSIRTDAAAFRQLKTTTGGAVQDEELLACWPSLGRVLGATLYPDRLMVAAAHMPELKHLTVSRRIKQIVDASAVRVLLGALSSRLHGLALKTNDKDIRASDWIPDGEWARLKSFGSSSAMADDLRWISRQSWAASLTSLDVNVRFTEGADIPTLTLIRVHLPQFVGLSYKLTELKLYVGARTGNDQIPDIAFACIPPSVTRLTLASGSRTMSSHLLRTLDKLKLRYLHIWSTFNRTTRDVEAFMDAQPLLQFLFLNFTGVDDDFLARITSKLPELKVFSMSGLKKQTDEAVGGWLEAHPLADRKSTWRSCREIVITGPKWVNEVVTSGASRICCEAAQLSSLQQTQFWSHACKPAVSVESAFPLDRIEIKTPVRHVRLLRLMAPLKLDDDFVQSALVSFPRLSNLSVCFRGETTVSWSKATLGQLAERNVQVRLDSPFVVSDGDYGDIVSLVAQHRWWFRCLNHQKFARGVPTQMPANVRVGLFGGVLSFRWVDTPTPAT